ncbi:MAG TPA: hypothetical protein VE035_06935 [Puia sp.]|nr:hypothetical protein [Puia sp.]
MRHSKTPIFVLGFLIGMLPWTGSYAQHPIGVFDNHTDIGNPKLSGSATYDEATQTYSISGAGVNIWFNGDQFQYVYKKIKGDFILTANFAFIGPTGNGHRKIGWMVRESLDSAASHISAVKHGDGLAVLQWRALRGAYMRDPEDEIFISKKSPEIIQVERSGKTIIMRMAHGGEPLQEVGVHEMPYFKDSILVGLFVCAHDPGVVEQAKIWNVRIDRPIPPGYDPYRQPLLGCRLETMDVFDGTRKVIHESTGRFEAPNWMPDGKKLLFNEGGSLYTIPTDGGETVKLNTGDVARNNNDHGISFDGKMLAISSSREGMPGGGSTVYTLPLAGGTPKLITEPTPSYFHGWAPNGKEVAVVGQRKDSKIYNLYKVSLKDGSEIPLTTNTTGHVDGPEYSPDGKYIYYNASVTGTMQIWRMRPDGSGQEQLSFDEYDNWFPHISPDGKWIVFISFPFTIDPTDHPFCQRVLLRLMPVAGGAPKVIAYLYGGQGTLNGPSWSPDSRHIAFVSNSGNFSR